MVESPGKVQAKYYATEVEQASCVDVLVKDNKRSVASQKGEKPQMWRMAATSTKHNAMDSVRCWTAA